MGLADASIREASREARPRRPSDLAIRHSLQNRLARRNEGSTVKAAHFPNEIDKSIGTKLRSRRMSIGLSQEQLAETLNLDPEDVSFFEQGLKRISAQQLLNIANALTVRPGYFFGVAGKSAEPSRRRRPMRAPLWWSKACASSAHFSGSTIRR